MKGQLLGCYCSSPMDFRELNQVPHDAIDRNNGSSFYPPEPPKRLRFLHLKLCYRRLLKVSWKCAKCRFENLILTVTVTITVTITLNHCLGGTIELSKCDIDMRLSQWDKRFVSLRHAICLSETRDCLSETSDLSHWDMSNVSLRHAIVSVRQANCLTETCHLSHWDTRF